MIDILCGGCVVFVCLMTILWILATRHQRQAIGREMHQLRTPTQRERIATIKALNPWPTTTGSEFGRLSALPGGSGRLLRKVRTLHHPHPPGSDRAAQSRGLPSRERQGLYRSMDAREPPRES